MEKEANPWPWLNYLQLTVLKYYTMFAPTVPCPPQTPKAYGVNRQVLTEMPVNSSAGGLTWQPCVSVFSWKQRASKCLRGLRCCGCTWTPHISWTRNKHTRNTSDCLDAWGPIHSGKQVYTEATQLTFISKQHTYWILTFEVQLFKSQHIFFMEKKYLLFPLQSVLIGKPSCPWQN